MFWHYCTQLTCVWTQKSSQIRSLEYLNCFSRQLTLFFASNGSSSDAIEEPYLGPQRILKSKVLVTEPPTTITEPATQSPEVLSTYTLPLNYQCTIRAHSTPPDHRLVLRLLNPVFASFSPQDLTLVPVLLRHRISSDGLLDCGLGPWTAAKTVT